MCAQCGLHLRAKFWTFTFLSSRYSIHSHTAGSAFTSEWSIDNFIMVVYEEFFLLDKDYKTIYGLDIAEGSSYRVFHRPSMVWWKTCNEHISNENLSFQCFMGNIDFHSWKYVNLEFFRKSRSLTPLRFELSTSRSLVRYFFHRAIKLVDVWYKGFFVQWRTLGRD